jgi:hypothetical protein
MPTAGYSATSLAKKLGLKEADIVYTNESSSVYLKRFDSVPSDIVVSGKLRPPQRFLHLFVTTLLELTRELPKLHKAMEPQGLIWVSWPKKASKVPTDVDENAIRDLALSMGLVDVKVCAVDDVWSGLKLVIPLKLRPKPTPRKR